MVGTERTQGAIPGKAVRKRKNGCWKYRPADAVSDTLEVSAYDSPTRGDTRVASR
jgi:hypothetical protein